MHPGYVAIFRLLHEDWVTDATAPRRSRGRPSRRKTRAARGSRR
jgi:hypothetical protein